MWLVIPYPERETQGEDHLLSPMEGPIDSCSFLEENLGGECFEGFFNHGSLRLSSTCEEKEAEEEGCFLMPNLEDKMPFLQMLQSVECPSLFPLKEPNFQTLLRLQHLKTPWETNSNSNTNSSFMQEMETQIIHPLELESCITHELREHSPPIKAEPNPRSPGPENGGFGNTQLPKPIPVRRKRKRTKPVKNKEEVESQRMTHIAVERNRRRQMNDHLSFLRSLMPPSYIQRGDQASIIGGAIDFVKELEQLLQCLQAQKRTRKSEESSIKNSFSNSAMKNPELQCGIGKGKTFEEEEEEANKFIGTEIKVNVIQNHVNLKIQCLRRSGQLLQAIITMEGLRLTVLHLNITSSQNSVLYSFNLKMEDDCNLKSVEEIEAAVHQIFR